MPRTIPAVTFLVVAIGLTSVALAGSRYPECDPYYACLGWTPSESDSRIEACTRVLNRKKGLCKADGEVISHRGDLYFEKGNYDLAILDYTSLIETQPVAPLAYLRRGLAFKAKGESERARADLQRAVELDPANKETQAALADIGNTAVTTKLPAAIQSSQQVGAESKQDYESEQDYLSAAKLIGMGRYADGILKLTNALHRNPNEVKLYKKRGYAYIATGFHEQAIADFRKAVELDPNDTAIASVLALLERSGKPIGSLPLDPRDAPVYNASLAEQLAATFPQKPNAAPTGISPQPPSTTAIQQTAVEQAKPIVKAPVQGTPSTAAIPLGKRVALVIGNDEYESLPDLKKAVNDAHAVGTALTKLGFEVLTLENTSRRDMNAKLVEFTSKIGPGDTGFFFFAGHGVQLRGTNYLLPIDTPEAQEGQEGLISGEGIAADTVLQEIQSRGAKVAMLVLDACRDNPFAKPGQRGVGGTRGLTLMTVPEGVFVLYSAGVGETALDRLTEDDPDPNSVFTRTFVSLLDQPGLTLHDIAKRTQRNVYELAKSVSHTQMPAYYDQILGELTLLPSN